MGTESMQKWGNGIVSMRPAGLYCELGDFYIDPWKPVDRALITHAHADHARPNSKHYLTAQPGVGVLGERVGKKASIEGLAYGKTLKLGAAMVSFHPAGHILGSGQIRIEHRGRVAVVTGDYKAQKDPSCHLMEPVMCDTLITECTFGLPIFKWPEAEEVFQEINTWWRDNAQSQKTSVLFVYSLGKAQRVLSGIDASIGPIGVHRAIESFLPHYESEGFAMPKVLTLCAENLPKLKGTGLILAPAAAQTGAWLGKLGDYSDASASGWMRVRGMRRWHAYDRGFVLSDHVDWDGLMQTIHVTGAHHVGATHGYTTEVVRYLGEQGLDAFEVPTRYVSDSEEDGSEV